MNSCKFSEIEILPERPAVYALYLDGTCIYVGISCMLRSRIRSHKSSGTVFDEIYYQPAREIELTPLERSWMETLKPTLNKRPAYKNGHPKRRRHGWYWSRISSRWIKSPIYSLGRWKSDGYCIAIEKYDPDIHLPAESKVAA